MPPLSTGAAMSGSTLSNAQRLGLGSGLSIGSSGQVQSSSQTPSGQRTAAGLTAPAGVKATVPGGLGTTQKNTIPSTYTAPASQQSATYNAQNSGAGTAPSGGSMGSLLKSPFQVDPNSLPALSNPQGQSTAYTAYNNDGTISQYGQGNGAGTSGQAGNTLQGTTGQLLQSSLNGSPSAQAYTTQTAQAGQGNIPIGQNAAAIAANYGQQIANVGSQGAKFEGGQLTTGTTPVAQGNAAITAQTTAAQQGALASGETAALAGTQQQLLAQQQAATAANEAAGQANTGQSLQQSGLQAGATLQTPSASTQQVGQGTTVLGANGQPIASTPVLAPVGSQTQYQVPAATYTNGQQNATPTSQGYNVQQGDTFNALAGQYGTTTQALEAANPGINPNNLQVGQRINIPQAQSTSGNSPFTAGQVAGQAGLGQTYAQNNAAITAAQGIQQKINADITTNGINSLSSATVANAANDWVKGQLSDPNLANFFNDLTDYTQTIAPLIGIAGSPTDAKTFISQQMVNGMQSGQTIMQVLDNLNTLAINKNSAVQSAGQGGTPVGQNNAGSQSTQVTSGGHSFQKNPQTGLWEVSQ